MNLFLFVFIILCYSCKEELNPFEFDNNINSNNDTIYFDDPSSFSALHNNIFSTTCANSGCHDGTFEPDFRTIESSYNSLVYQPPIKNDANNSFDYRVKPGDAIQSVLYHRLIVDIDGISGIMPLEYEDDWGNNKDVYDYEDMTMGFNSADGIRLDVDFDRSLADDEGIDYEADPADLIRDDLAHFTIEFSTPDGKEIALCDFTYYGGYNPLIVDDIGNLTDEELDEAIKGMAEV